MPELIEVLETALGMAKTGQLQSFIGTGFNSDGFRFAIWCDTHEDVYQMAGSLSWLLSEYQHRHT